MGFFIRAMTGIVLTVLTISLVGAAGWRLHNAITTTEKPSKRPVRERSYAVDVDVLSKQSITPTITSYGQLLAWNTLEIRAPSVGPATEISKNFRDGLAVKKGELLFKIDPEVAERRVIDARAALTQAELELDEAQLSVRHMQADIDATKAQIEVRDSDLQRKTKLYARKLTTVMTVDDATLALSAANQTLVAKQQEQIALTSRIERAKASVSRAQLVLSDSEKSLEETSYAAPFAGRLSEVSLTLGRRVSQNEKLALLIDPSALEVSFPVRNSEFGTLLDARDGNKLAPLPIEVSLELSGKTVKVAGTLDRTAAVASNVSGRTVYARLNEQDATKLRPGDFVTVSVNEPELTGIAVIPADAATVDGRILLVNDQNRLVEHQAKIVRRQSETLVVADVPFGQQFVRRRLPFLAGGVKVTPRDTNAPPSTTPIAATTDKSETSVAALNPKRRAELIAFLKANQRIPEDRRSRLLEELSKVTPSSQALMNLERMVSRSENRS